MGRIKNIEKPLLSASRFPIIQEYGNCRETHHPLNPAVYEIAESGKNQLHRDLEDPVISEDIKCGSQRDEGKASFHR